MNCVGLTTAAKAATFTCDNYGFSNENVHITDTLLNVENECGGAGLITLDSSSDLTACCVYIADRLLRSWTSNAGVNPTTNLNLAVKSSITGDSKIADIAALIANGSNITAVQVAIWETEYRSSVTMTPDDPGL